jgi:putative ABC transport system permease protein
LLQQGPSQESLPLSVWQLVIKEIMRRKVNFASGLVAVTLAVAVMAGSMTILKLHDLSTQQIVREKEDETLKRMAVLEDDYRKIMKILGFNLLIFPESQKLSDFYSDETVSAYMPDSYATRLAEAKIVTIRHLLPTLQEKVVWPEKKRTIILIGTRGEVPSLFRDAREPILVAVPKGQAVVGHELARSFELKAGDRITLFGKSFKISQCNEERGSKDDISIWIDLSEAQQMMGKPGRINAILALKCHCAGNELANVRRDVAAVLPGVQVIEQGSKVLTRAEARDRASREASEALAAEVRSRKQLRDEQERFSSILVPLVLMVSALWVGLVFNTNVRERRTEIGILRALGARARTILRLFLTKALLMGFAGGLAGYALGTLIVLVRPTGAKFAFLDLEVFILASSTAVLLSLAASWIPAFYAAQQDPAEVLREE